MIDNLFVEGQVENYVMVVNLNQLDVVSWIGNLSAYAVSQEHHVLHNEHLSEQAVCCLYR